MVKALGYPCTNTLMGLGGFPASDPLFIGMLGMHGTYESNMAMYECDVMLAVGARFDDRVTGDLKKFSPTARIIHVDADPTSIGKNVPVEVPIVGEAKEVLADMQALIPDGREHSNTEAIEKWWQRIKEWQSLKSLNYDRNSELIKPQFVIEKLFEVTGGDAYVTSDVVSKMVMARTKGVVISISSICAAGNAGQGAYSAAKAGVNAATRSWAKELGPFMEGMTQRIISTLSAIHQPILTYIPTVQGTA
jgi:thiamine pyrophosphate-dependent acetolactate synthase large subunit-like protein